MVPLNPQYKPHQIPTLPCFSFRLAIVFGQSIEARCEVENEGEAGAARQAMLQLHLSDHTILLLTKM